jgi:disulfide oxidoreductase YuzD
LTIVLDLGLAAICLDLVSFSKTNLLTLHWFVDPVNLCRIPTLPTCFVLGFGKMGLGRAQQHHTFCVHMSSCSTVTWVQPGLSRGFVDFLLLFNFIQLTKPDRHKTDTEHAKLRIELLLKILIINYCISRKCQ